MSNIGFLKLINYIPKHTTNGKIYFFANRCFNHMHSAHFLMLLIVALGNRMRKKFWNIEEGDAKGGVNSLLGALFGLWGFMLAFTFGQAGTRFETVRLLIVDEGNVLRNTIKRADFFPDSIRGDFRADLRKYLEERISYYEEDFGGEKFRANRNELSKTATDLWKKTVDLSRRPELSGAANNMASNLTNLFDTGTNEKPY